MTVPIKQNAVVCQGVGYTYPNGTVALSDISLTIQEREKVAIIGPNGAGKSTFLTLLNGLRKPEGEIRVFNMPVSDKFVKRIRALVGLAFQNPDDHLFCPTVFDDVAFGPLSKGLSQEETAVAVQRALEEIGLQNKMQAQSLNLSYGERKLVSLASILAMQPRLIALDEPTGNLDAWHRRRLINWISRYRGTLLLATHDLDMALETCQRVFLFNQGVLAASGDCQTVLSNRVLLHNNKLELPLTLQSNQA
ncbi:MAG TPA: ABC transporter ATP-binding protein [Caldithrix abyssi]|uniref:ABC transporter ATP-binding protein n=1 Tax=Caldithrix abyssi TaxID=187145 RepID=A0A7V4WW73_CALAY|nr:ABC transporter ATP-binding protein [Caldithrix abyssi]